MISDARILQLLTASNENFGDITTPELKVEVESLSEETSIPSESVDDVVSTEQDSTPNPVSVIFTEAAAEKLSRLPVEQLLSMTLKEALTELSTTDIQGPWVRSYSESNKETANASFIFSKYTEASSFVTEVLLQSRYSDCEVANQNLFYKDGYWAVDLCLVANTLALTAKELQIIQYCNYRFSVAVTDPEAAQMFSEPIETSTEEDLFKYRDSLSAIPIQVLGEGDKKTLRVPVAVLGDWVHPVYGELKFSQQDFDDMKANVKTKVIGYEPPLFLGHIETQPGTPEYPAEGFLEKLTQEGEVLYGDFDVVNDSTYSSVSKGQFRYSSGEFLRNHKDKKTGNGIGTTLVGVALTNRPFLTGMPRVTTLSDTRDHISTVLLTDISMTTQAPVETPKENLEVTYAQKLSELKSELLSEFQQVKESYTEDVAALKEQLSEAFTKVTEATAKVTETEQKLSEVTADRDKFSARVLEVEAEKRQDAVEVKLSELNALVIPKEQKEKYSELIKSGALGENEDTILASLKEISVSLSDVVTTQHGVETATHGQNDDSVSDPYLETIKRNQKLAEDREALLLQKLA